MKCSIAGCPGEFGYEDGIGSAVRFDEPRGLASDGYMLYVVEPNVIRRIDLVSGMVATISGAMGNPRHVDGTGQDAGFNVPWRAEYVYPYLYVTDTGNNVIRRIE